MSFTELFSQSEVTVESLSSARDAGGGSIYTWSETFTDVLMRIEDASAASEERFARRQMLVTHECFTTQSGIRVGMRIVEGDHKYLVRETIENRGTGRIPTYYQIFCEEQREL